MGYFEERLFNEQAQEIQGVTVCVAAITFNTAIVGAADRMLSTEDIEYEPQVPKIWQVTNNVVAMAAGNSAIQAEILQMAQAEIFRKYGPQTSQLVSVQEVASLYAESYRKIQSRAAADAVLGPLDLDLSTFVSKNSQLSPDLAVQLASELIQYGNEDTSAATDTIIAGVDSYPYGLNPHLYVVQNSQTSCRDYVGFAAVGTGAWHATSELMSAGQARDQGLIETLLAVVSGKKRAQVAPGVGDRTDMFMVNPHGVFTRLTEENIQRLERIYDERVKKAREAEHAAKTSLAQYFKELSQQTEEADTQTDKSGVEGAAPETKEAENE